MKKGIMILGIGALAFFLFGGEKKDTAANNNPSQTPINQGYNGKIIVAPGGNWYYVLNNNIYYVSQAAFEAWLAVNPDGHEIQVTQDVVDQFTIIGDVDPVTIIGK